MATTKKLLYVRICEAKPHPMFTEEQRRSVRFLIYNQYIPCAHCGKKRKVMWTMRCAFRSIDMELTFHTIGNKDGKPFPPLTPVCDAHPLGVDWPSKPSKPKKQKKKVT